MTKKYSVLYAEDEDNVRSNYVMYLHKYFNVVYEASDGEEALDLYRNKTPDIVILDITMPLIDGLEVAHTIRKNDLKTPIIILSAHSDEKKLLKAVKLQLLDYLIKPIERAELEEVISSAKKRILEDRPDASQKNVLMLKNGHRWDKTTSILYQKDKIIALKKSEAKLFGFFIEKHNQVLEPLEIHDFLRGEKEVKYNYTSIRNLISGLRKKLPKEMIENIYGQGYLFKL
ncbi:MAG: response regulator [Campylobacterota bacterium]|nr:response regulator [Campylobacterota bacterium]